MRSRTAAAVLASASLLLAAPGPVASAPATAPALPASAAPIATGMTEVLDVSKDGRIALGRLGQAGPVVLRDLAKGRTLRTLRSGSAYSYKSLSSTGRYVHFTKAYTRAGCTYARPWVLDRVTGKSRLAATTRKGKPLVARWNRAGQCPSMSYTEAAFSPQAISGPGQMSPDGRWVAFCANLEDPDRGDLYVKDMRTRKLTIKRDFCHFTTEIRELHPVHVSEGARTIMIIFNDAGSTTTYNADLLLKRRTLHQVALPGATGFQEMRLTDDGSAVYAAAGGGSPAGRYDTASGAVSALVPGDPVGSAIAQPGDELREQTSMSRRGRYAAYHGSRVDPSLGRVGLIGVLDRESGQPYDLTAAMLAAGVPQQVGSPPMVSSLVPVQITADGKVVLIGTPSGWVSVRWMP